MCQVVRLAVEMDVVTNEAANEFLKQHDWTVETIREDHYRIDDEVMLAVPLE